LSVEIPNVKLIVPKVGDKKRIVELSEKMQRNIVWKN
jgi:excinuclease ABC subunit C